MEMATRSSTLAWEISWTEEPGGLHSLWGCKGVGPDSVTKQQQQLIPTALHMSTALALRLCPYQGCGPQTLPCPSGATLNTELTFVRETFLCTFPQNKLVMRLRTSCGWTA